MLRSDHSGNKRKEKHVIENSVDSIAENGGEKVDHGSGGISPLRAA
jgi:hypothetical protein